MTALAGSLLSACATSVARPRRRAEAPGQGHELTSRPAPVLEPGVVAGAARFVGEDLPVERFVGHGWDGRFFTDLAKHHRIAEVTPNDSFFVRTFAPDRVGPTSPWVVRLGGRVTVERMLSIDELRNAARPMGCHVLECSGNTRRGGYGLLSAATWSGIPLLEALERVAPKHGRYRVLVAGDDKHTIPSKGGHSVPGASWVFTRDELERAGAFLATEMNGAPLASHHGAPVRLVVPGWYGCTCIKWVDRIELVDDDVHATAQMREFAIRTHQPGVLDHARDYEPASIDQAAVATRLERLVQGRRPALRIHGLTWGGTNPSTRLAISVGDGPFSPVTEPPAQVAEGQLTPFSTVWSNPSPGTWSIRFRVSDHGVRQRRLDRGYYTRMVQVEPA